MTVRSGGLGKGSTFTFSLPIVATHVDARKSVAEERNAALDKDIAQEDLQRYRILVVDDEPDSLTVLKRILERAHATVQVASSVAEALERFDVFKPDLVLSDIGMPESDGYDLIRQLRRKPSGTIPVIALTALVRAEDRLRTLRAGFQMHLGKPVNPEELVASIRNLMMLRS